MTRNLPIKSRKKEAGTSSSTNFNGHLGIQKKKAPRD